MKNFTTLDTDTIVRGFVLREENRSIRVWATTTDAKALAKEVGLELMANDYCGEFGMSIDELTAEINSF